MKLHTTVFQSVTHLFFPHTCCGCGTDLLAEKTLFCIYCHASMPFTRFEDFPANPIEKIFWGRTEIETAMAHLYFTSGSAVQHSLHLLKYKDRKDIGIYFGRMMGSVLKQSRRFNLCDVLIPLPLFAKRERKRGYNQAALIAEGISNILQIPVVYNAVIRVKGTGTQTHKSRIQRWKNMEEMFKIGDPAQISGKHLLLVDDVITTGATLEACAQILLSVPDVRISIACLAHSVSG